MALSNAQLLMLDNLIYTDYCQNGDSVETIINRMEYDIDQGITIGGCMMSNEEWRDLAETIRKDPGLLNYTVQEYKNDENTGMRAALFVDDVESPKDVNIVFRGTAGDYEWHDNGTGGYLADTEQQERAAEYVNNLPAKYGNMMTVTGHSKGGNKSQYVTIVTDRIARCVSFDGQGFSPEFLEKYQDKIKKRANSIVSISSSEDYVNCLLFPIAGTRMYIQTESQPDFLHNHKPNILLDSNGNLRPQTEQSALSVLINEYTTYMVSTLPEPERSYTIDGLIALLESGESKESLFQTVFACVDAASHLDDFAFHYIEKKAGFPARLLTATVAAVLCPYLFLDDLMECGKDMVDYVVGGLVSLAGAIGEKLAAFGDRIKAFGTALVEGIASFASSVREGFRMMFDRGYQYATDHTYISINTSSMRSYADRLTAVNKRVVDLDKRLDSLYWKVGWRDLLNLMRADVMTGYNWHIDGCVRYLKETATDFENAEKKIAAQY